MYRVLFITVPARFVCTGVDGVPLVVYLPVGRRLDWVPLPFAVGSGVGVVVGVAVGIVGVVAGGGESAVPVADCLP